MKGTRVDRMRRLLPHLEPHVLLFDRRPAASYGAHAGLRLLLIVLLLEGLVGPRLTLLTAIGLPAPPMLLRVPLLLTAALLLVRYAAGVKHREIGVYPWRDWTLSEKSYFVQITVLAVAVFGTLAAPRLRAVAADSALWGPAALTVAAYLLWGFYQELIYRGLLQTELVRRWGVAAGIGIANAAYTFGPLHSYYLSRYVGAELYGMFGAVFMVGFFFGLLFHRSGNLTIVGVFHGIGDAFLTGLPTVA